VITRDGIDPDARPACGSCGSVADTARPVTWSVSVEAGRRVWTCERCAREHVRSIEAKLDSSWW
jgi:hypothetical protein